MSRKFQSQCITADPIYAFQVPTRGVGEDSGSMKLILVD
jgi:hypothetical protein